jgi:hypothetical protein
MSKKHKHKSIIQQIKRDAQQVKREARRMHNEAKMADSPNTWLSQQFKNFFNAVDQAKRDYRVLKAKKK